MKTDRLEKTVMSTIEKLEKLQLEEKLKAELAWCLGSYRFDKNPDGLLEKSERALEVLKITKEKNSRAVSQKLLGELESLVY